LVEALGSGKGHGHGGGDEVPVELTQRAVREHESGRGAIARVATGLGLNPETLRGWVRQDDKGKRSTGELVEGSELRKLSPQLGREDESTVVKG